ncbi:MAG TPA: oligosaccharide flippase family protein [Fibrobacteria bacterium]|nr:oligosaccharide flippase family protein [Fibrobacteria bacterium]
MLDRIGKLLGHSAVYMASNFLQRGLSFLLIPLYAAYFTTAEFGAMDMLYQTAITLSLVASLGLPQGLVRGFYLAGTGSAGDGGSLPEAERRKLMGALVTFLVPVLAVVTVLLLIFAEPLSRSLFRNEGNAQWIRMVAWLNLALVLQGLPLQLYKTQQRSRAFAAWSLATFALIAGGNLYFIVVLKWGLSGMLWGNLLGVGVTGAILVPILLPNLELNWEWRRLAPLFAFGLPMLPNLLSRRVLEVASRYMLPHWHGLSEVGFFSMGARVAAIIDILLLVPFLYAWQPFFYSLAGKPDAPRIFARVTHYFFLLMVSIFLLLQILRLPLLHFLGRGKYDAAGPVVSLLVLAAMFNGIQYCVSAGIHLRKKLVAEMGIMAGAAVFNLLFNFILIPRHGATGAAAAAAAAYFLYLAGTFLLAQGSYPVPYLWRRGGTVFLSALAAFAALQKWDSPAVQIPILFSFLVVGPLRDLLRHGELRQARNFAADRWRRMRQRMMAKNPASEPR